MNKATSPAAASLPSALTVSYVLENKTVDDLNKGECDTWSEEQVAACLEENGVKANDDDSTAENRKEACRILRQDGRFWQRHHSLHPNSSRVKNWAWVHDRYRAQAEALLVSGNQGDDAKARKAAFDKFHGKIVSHSEFEDTQLFKYFCDAKLGDQEAFAQLQSQHGDLQGAKEIQSLFDKLMSAAADDDSSKERDSELQSKLQSYVDDLKAHLDKEECTILKLWLQLTPEQYKKYRSYLSWTYCFMY